MKEVEFNLEHAREAFMEAKKSFVEASTSGRKDKPELKNGPLYAHNFPRNLYEVIARQLGYKRATRNHQ